MHEQLRKGDAHYEKKEYKQAAEAYRNAGDGPRATYNLGNATYRRGDYEGAASLFEKSSTGLPAPEAADALHNLGNCRLQQRDFKRAVEAYEKSLRLRPNDPDTKMNLQMAKKKWKEAEQKNKGTQERPEGQRQQQPQNNESGQPDQPQQPGPGDTPQPDDPANQPPQPGPETRESATMEEARRMLETAIGPADMKTAKKYREKGKTTPRRSSGKDW